MNLQRCECAQRKDKDKRKKKLKNWRHSKQEMARGFWGGIVSFWGIRLKCRKDYKGCSSHSECNPVPLCHLWQEKKLWRRHHGIIFQESRQNWTKQQTRTRTCAIDVRCEWNCSLPYLLLLTILQLYQFPYPLPSPVSSSCLFTQWL